MLVLIPITGLELLEGRGQRHGGGDTRRERNDKKWREGGRGEGENVRKRDGENTIRGGVEREREEGMFALGHVGHVCVCVWRPQAGQCRTVCLGQQDVRAVDMTSP